MYQEITVLNQKGNVHLVRNQADGLLYVRKRVITPYPELYYELRDAPVKNTPRLAAVYGEGGALTVIEEYLAGVTLAERLEQDGCLSEGETAELGIRLCRILQEMHSRGLVHRDIKPANIMLLPEGQVYLLDFDAVKPVSQGSRDTVLLGTQGYAAPEQYGFGASTPQTDLYALGVLLNICLCGKIPGEMLCDGKFRRIIQICVRPNPRDRYHCAKELLTELKRIQGQRLYWLPPGFRTGKWYKMLLACVGYGFLLAVVFSMSEKTFDSQLEHWLCQMTILLTGVVSVFFYGNYLNIRRVFPFMRSRYRVLRLVGFMLAPAWIYWLLILVATLLEWLLCVKPI